MAKKGSSGKSKTGAFGADPYFPAVGFYFEVKFNDFKSKVDAHFKEVNGISVELETGLTVKEGGENRYQVQLPGRTKYPDLELKRGLLSAKSDLASWCYGTMQRGHSQAIKPKDLKISLLNEKGEPLKTWCFYNSYPKKIAVNNFNAQATGDSAIVVESITLAYNYFEVVKS